MERVARGNVQCLSWEKYFLNHDFLKDNGLASTRVAILSGTDVDVSDDHTIKTVLSRETLRNKNRWKEDWKASHLQSSLEANNMKFTVLDLGQYYFKNMTSHDHQNSTEKMLQDIKSFHPSVVVLPFCGAKFAEPNNSSDILKQMISLPGNRPLDGRDGVIGADIVKLLRKKPSLWSMPIVVTEGCLILKSSNMFGSNYTFLSSATTVCASGIEDSLPRLLSGIKFLGDPKYISVLCISGTHGNLDGSSGFSDSYLLERKFYEETCKLLGIKPQVSMFGSNAVVLGFSQSYKALFKMLGIISEPDPIPQPLDGNAHDDAILKNPLYEMMKYNVLDIKHFHRNEEGLIKYVRAFGPNAIVLDWCFAKDGDVAKILCKSGILSELWLKHERTSMVGISDGRWINLDSEQTPFDLIPLFETVYPNIFTFFSSKQIIPLMSSRTWQWKYGSYGKRMCF